MAFPVFTWLPSFELQANWEPPVRHAPLGDGYSARTPVGLRRRNRIWNLRFGEITATEAAEIQAFLEGRDGYRPFTWTPPSIDKTPGLWVVRRWSVRQRNGVVYEISATFEEE